MESVFVPRIIADVVDRLEKATGHGSCVDRVDVRTWRLVTETDHVRLTVDYAIAGNGKVRWKGSTLAVDGEFRPLAKNFADLVRIFKEAEATSASADEEKPPVVFPMPPARPIDDAPAMVQAAYQALTRGGKFCAEVGEDDKGGWMLGVETETCALRLEYSQQRGKWGVRFQVVVDGVDRSKDAKGDLNKAIKLLQGPGAPPEATKKIGNPTAGARNTGVESRRITVIRT